MPGFGRWRRRAVHVAVGLGATAAMALSPGAGSAASLIARPATGTASATAKPSATSGGWHLQTLPGLERYQALAAVSCPSSTFCMGVGQGRNGALVSERWSGRTWSRVPLPTPRPQSLLESISCVSYRACMAVGLREGRVPLHTLAEWWNGRSWSVLTTPNLEEGGFTGVSCFTATGCMAVGQSQPPEAGDSVTMAERWNGRHWKVLSIPADGDADGMYDVSCGSATLCFSVDNAYGVAKWNGHTWAAEDQGRLASTVVSCSSARFCVSLGCRSADTCMMSGSRAAFVWNGTAWRRKANLSNSTALSCASPSWCGALGEWTASGKDQSGILYWNGEHWTREPLPASLSTTSLAGISCHGRACEVVGVVPPSGAGFPRAVALRWS